MFTSGIIIIYDLLTHSQHLKGIHALEIKYVFSNRAKRQNHIIISDFSPAMSMLYTLFL